MDHKDKEWIVGLWDKGYLLEDITGVTGEDEESVRRILFLWDRIESMDQELRKNKKII
jgi:hypothetical protein